MIRLLKNVVTYYRTDSILCLLPSRFKKLKGYNKGEYADMSYVHCYKDLFVYIGLVPRLVHQKGYNCFIRERGVLLK